MKIYKAEDLQKTYPDKKMKCLPKKNNYMWSEYVSHLLEVLWTVRYKLLRKTEDTNSKILSVYILQLDLQMLLPSSFSLLLIWIKAQSLYWFYWASNRQGHEDEIWLWEQDHGASSAAGQQSALTSSLSHFAMVCLWTVPAPKQKTEGKHWNVLSSRDPPS